MELIIKPFHSLPCELEVFTINGIAANSMDFGDVYDHNEESKESYGCGDMQFKPKLPTSEVLQHYNITVDEYSDKLYHYSYSYFCKCLTVNHN